MSKILVIDDDQSICELIKINLELAGHNCIYCTDPIKGYALIKQEMPDLLILDVMMGEVDGYSLALKIRQNDNIKNIPIIMLTALGELQDKLRGFNSGVDDYLTKPFEIEELKARVLALLNRSGLVAQSLRFKEVLTLGDITLIPESYSVKILDKSTKLTPIEFEILNVLMQEDIDTIRVHIRHLRSKIDGISDEKNKYIETIYGGGYRLIPTGVKSKNKTNG